MNKPMLSVIVPVYNVEKYIAQCIDSILAQTFEDLELILVDDKGADSSMDVARKIATSYKGAKSINIVEMSSNGGLAAARNGGVAAARGEYIFFIDSDDYLAGPDVIEALIRRQIETQADVVTANSTMFDDLTGRIFQVVDADYNDSYYPNQSAKSEVRLGAVAWNKLIRKSFIKENDLYFDEGIVWEDAAWVFKLMCSSPRVATLNLKTYMYRYRAGSIMNTLTPNHLRSKILLPLMCAKWLSMHPTSKKEYAAVTLEDMKQGGYLALNQTFNSDRYKWLFDIYNHRLNYIQFSFTSLASVVKIFLGRLPVSLYIPIARLRIARFLNSRPTRQKLYVKDSFWEDLEKEISHLPL